MSKTQRLRDVYTDPIKDVRALPDIDGFFFLEREARDEPEELRRSGDRSREWPEDRSGAHDVRLGVALFRCAQNPERGAISSRARGTELKPRVASVYRKDVQHVDWAMHHIGIDSADVLFIAVLQGREMRTPRHSKRL